MNDWFRSIAALGGAFLGVVAVTFGLAMVIVLGPAASSQATDATPRVVIGVTGVTVEVTVDDPDVIVDVSGAVDAVPTRVGGTLVVSGDRQGTFTVNRESIDGRYGRYGLSGDDGRIFFANDPLAVEQMNFDGMSFFPEPDECTITPGELNAVIGVATAHLHCEDIADVRGNGVVTVDGTIGLAGDLLGMRGDLPPTGGTVDIGDETLVIAEAVLFIGPRPVVVGGGGYGLRLVAADGDSSLGFDDDPITHELVLVWVELDGSFAPVADDACIISTQEIGVLNPRTTVFELSLECSAVDVPGLGPVPIAGTVIFERIESPS